MFRLAEPLSSIQSRLCEQSKFLKAGADSGTMWAAFEAAECTAHIASSVSVCLSPNGLQWQEVRSQGHGGVVPNRLAEGVRAREGFCPSTDVLALAPTTPNPTVYGVHLYQTCTFSVPFRQKNALIVSGPASRLSLARILKPAELTVKTPPRSRPGPLPEIPPVLDAGPGRGEVLSDAHQRKGGPFPPQETASYAESCRNISAKL